MVIRKEIRNSTAEFVRNSDELPRWQNFFESGELKEYSVVSKMETGHV